MIIEPDAFDGRGKPSADSVALGAIDHFVAVDGLESIAVSERPVPLGHELSIRGWALPPSPTRTFERFDVRAGGVAASVRYGTMRPDVAAVYGGPALGPCGFEATFETSELGVGEHEIRFEGDGASLTPMRVRVGPPTMRYERSSRYRATIERFGDEDHTFALPFSVQRLFMAVVSGRLDDVRGARARLARATVDVGEPFPVQLGLRLPDGSANGFLACFATESLAIGRHRFRLTALSEDDEYGVAADVPFDVVPIACDGPPVYSPVDASAEIECIGRSGGVVYVRGWAIDPIAMDSAGRVYLDFDDGTQYHMNARQHRRDIAERCGAPKALYCGFVGSVDTRTLTPGRRIGRVHIIDKFEQLWYRTSAEIFLDVVQADFSPIG